MSRKPILEIIGKIKAILQKESGLSIRQLSIKTRSQWRTVNKALETMKSLGIVKETANKETNRKERLFSLKNS